jgi:ABC-type glycerol-3-phosphate transport system permease component
MFEHISKPVLPAKQFQSRLMRSVLVGLGLIVISLAIGMAGYSYFFPKLDWADAFVNAAMILSGMGPLATPETTGAKIFSGCYAIYSGLMLVMSAGVVFAPLVHRFLHKMHADEADDREENKRASNTKR